MPDDVWEMEDNDMARKSGAVAEKVAKPAPPKEEVTPPPGTIKVKVSVKYTATTHTINIDVGEHKDLFPATRTIRELIPYVNDKKAREYFQNYSGYYVRDGLRDILRYGYVAEKECAEAIAGYLIAKLTKGDTGDSSVIIAPHAYLAVGDVLYRLEAREVLPTNKALKALRASIKEKATAQADNIIAAARESANTIALDAGKKREEAAKILADAKMQGRATPPKWVLDNKIPCVYWPIRKSDYVWEPGWAVLIKLVYAPTEFYYEWSHAITRADKKIVHAVTIYRWKAEKAPPVNTMMVVPLDDNGKYAFSYCGIADGWPSLPHAVHGSACMGPGTAPTVIASASDLKVLASGVDAAFKKVNLSSLYHHYINWAPELKAFVPKELKRWIVDMGSETAFGYDMSTNGFPKPDSAESYLPEWEQQTTWISEEGISK